jgi:phage-related protein (TIGR01555 family)
VATLVTEASTDVIKYQGLAAMMGNTAGEGAIRQRFALAKILKSVNNVMLLDQNEEFQTHSTAFGGVADVLDRFLAVVSGAADVPVTRLIGTAAKGLNATGDGDLKNYYDSVKAWQGTNFRKPLKTLDKILQRHIFGAEIDDWAYTWNPLFQLSEMDLASAELSRAQKDQIYVDMGAIDAYIVAKELSENSSYTNIDADFLKKVEGEVEEMKDLEKEMMTGGIDDETGEKPNAGGGEGVSVKSTKVDA